MEDFQAQLPSVGSVCAPVEGMSAARYAAGRAP
jgi:hypothetical protein